MIFILKREYKAFYGYSKTISKKECVEVCK